MDLTPLINYLPNPQQNYAILVEKSASPELRPHFLDSIVLIEGLSYTGYEFFQEIGY